MAVRVGGWGEVPQKAVRRMVSLGVVSDPLTDEDKTFLTRLSLVWGDRDLLRWQLSKLSKKERILFLETSDLGSNWERWAYTRLKNDKPVLGKPPRNVHLLAEIRSIFTLGGEITDEYILGNLRRIRRKIINERYRLSRADEA